METPAYQAQAEHLYPPDFADAKPFYDAFKKAGVCFSCGHLCPDLKVNGKCPPFPEVPFPL